MKILLLLLFLSHIIHVKTLLPSYAYKHDKNRSPYEKSSLRQVLFIKTRLNLIQAEFSKSSCKEVCF